MLKKIGRWASGRLQGSKGVKKYDDWMKRNPWASTALAVGDVALAGYAAPKLIGGAGKLKGLLSPGAAEATTRAGRTVQRLGEAARPAVNAARPVAGKVASIGRDVGKFAMKNPLPTALALQGAVEGYGTMQENRFQREQMARQRQQQENLAQLLIPLYRQYYGGQ